MATRTPGPSQGSRTERTRSKDAGAPVNSNTGTARGAASGPTDAELDARDRTKSGPRRQAGPPLAGDTPEPVPTRAVPDAQLTPPTDPQ
jgi:hypothetical protein